MHIELGHVHVRHRGRSVLHDVSLTIGSGDSVALMGPSGSGKTTLLSVIGGLVRPDDGSVSIDLGEANQRRREIRWVLQTVNSFGTRTVRDNVALGGMVSGRGRRRSLLEADAILQRVGLADLGDATPNTLSGGEVQRMVVARALMFAPPLILADEPTGQLDRASAERVARALVQARTKDTIVVVATHDPAVAEFCSRHIDVHDGHLHEAT